MLPFLTKQFFIVIMCFGTLFLSLTSNAQTTIRYQSTIRGGATMIGNSWYYSNTSAAFQTPLLPDIDADASTTHSTSADLILPTGSNIVKAYLSIERNKATADVGALTSVKFKVPGSSSYTTLNASTALVSRVASFAHQTIFDITSLMPANGYVSTAGGGTAGRYFVADPLPLTLPTNMNDMGGWSIIVVYSNTVSRFRNVTVADGWQYFINNTVNTDVTGVSVPATGSFNTVVGVTGTYGDRTYGDNLAFGLSGGVLTNLADPVTASTTDALNSTIGWAAQNNVSADGGPSISGNITTRNPISAAHIYGAAESWDFDCDIFNATGVLTNSSTPLTVRLSQISTGGDVLNSGSYFISVDAQTPVILTKAVSPTTITQGGTATYTFTLNNTSTGNVAQSGVNFSDLLPSGLQIAAVPNIVVTGLTGGVVTANPGGTVVAVSNYSIAANTTATITVRVTNAPGQSNTSCGANPSAFTNTASNIYGVSSNIDNQIGNVCLVVTPLCAAGTVAPPVQ